MDASQGEVPEEDASFQLDIYSRAIDRPACRPRNHAEHAQRQKSLSLPVPVYAPGLRQDRPGATASESANMSVPSSKLTARPVAGGGGAVGEDAVAGEAGAVASVGNRQAPSSGDMMRQAAAAEMPVVCFAGEATSASFGTVGGALESGRREARRLLSAWGHS